MDLIEVTWINYYTTHDFKLFTPNQSIAVSPALRVIFNWITELIWISLSHSRIFVDMRSIGRKCAQNFDTPLSRWNSNEISFKQWTRSIRFAKFLLKSHVNRSTRLTRTLSNLHFCFHSIYVNELFVPVSCYHRQWLVIHKSFIENNDIIHIRQMNKCGLSHSPTNRSISISICEHPHNAKWFSIPDREGMMERKIHHVISIIT